MPYNLTVDSTKWFHFEPGSSGGVGHMLMFPRFSFSNIFRENSDVGWGLYEERLVCIVVGCRQTQVL